MFGADDEDREFLCVKNDEEQYSIWPVNREIPAGWVFAGKRGVRQDCLDWIDQVWTDMRPLSLRQKMGAETSPAD